jgi:hypothetical protein
LGDDACRNNSLSHAPLYDSQRSFIGDLLDHMN